MRISIVIPTHNRKALLHRCLTAVTHQDYPDYEVIVVDDGSTDGTEAMVRREFPQVRYIRQEPSRGPGAARNRGIEAATGEVVAFTDDDCVPPKDWLSQLSKGFQQFPEVAAVGGIQEASKQVLYTRLLARYERFVTRRVYQVGDRPVVSRPAPGGTNNLAVRRLVLEQVGGFDERFPVAAGEDADLLYRIALAGYPTVCLPLKVTHLQPYTWRHFFRQQIRRGVGAAYFDHKWGLLCPGHREVMRLLVSPLLWVRESIRYRDPGAVLIHTMATTLQAWGRLRARGRLGRNGNPHHWQIAASPLKLSYIDKYAVAGTVLDVGSGRGFYAHHLRSKGAQVIAVDYHPARTAGFPVVQARLNALPFPHATFDTVLAFDVLEHEIEEKQALEELCRVVRKRLLISVPNAHDRPLLPYNVTYKHHVDKTHQREYTSEELRAKLEWAGFQVLVLRAEGPVDPSFFAEFVRPAWLRPPIRMLIRLLHRMGILKNDTLMADVYAVAEPRS